MKTIKKNKRYLVKAVLWEVTDFGENPFINIGNKWTTAPSKEKAINNVRHITKKLGWKNCDSVDGGARYEVRFEVIDEANIYEDDDEPDEEKKEENSGVKVITNYDDFFEGNED